MLLIINGFFLYISKWITLKVREKCKIWDVEGSPTSKTSQNSNRDEKINDKDNEESVMKFNEQSKISNELIFRKIERVDILRSNEDKVRLNIKIFEESEYYAGEYKDDFLEKNKMWLKDNLGNLLSPKTILKNKQLILDKFFSIKGPLKQWNENDNLEAEIESKSIHQKEILNLKDKESIRNNLYQSNSFIEVFNYWLKKAKLLVKINTQIAGVLERATASECDFCQSTWGLKCESITDPEDTFKNFLKEYKDFEFSIYEWDIDDWQEYFQ